jgi:type I restriction enzyme M protein
LVNIKKINKDSYDLSVKNPNQIEENNHQDPMEIVKEIQALDQQTNEILKTISKLL